jgi:DNA polymerase-3 subunit delta'
MYPWLASTYNQLSVRIQQRKLHHGLLLQGPSGLGKRFFAEQLAKLLLCARPQGPDTCGVCQACLLSQAGHHPDFYQVESEKQIGVDQIRESIKSLTGAAQLSGAKVLIIHQADTMTESSANALLKTLEEPTEHTYLLLTTDKSERILPTIKSRCEKLALPQPMYSETLTWIKQAVGDDIDENLVKLFSHRPLALSEELQQEASFSFNDFQQGLADVLSGNTSPSLLAVKWQESIEKVLKWLQFWSKEQLLQSSKHKNNQDLLFSLSDELSYAVKQIQNPGINKTLLLSQVLSQVVNTQNR